MKNIILFLFCFLQVACFAQAGLSISPGKMFFRDNAGSVASQKVRISNPNNKAVEVGVSLNDWNYTEQGVNHIADANTLAISCATWIQVLPSSFFIIEPNETKEIEVIMNIPADLQDDVPVHTGMIFFTQLNPGDALDENGAAIKVTVRMGLKVYHALTENQESIEITDIKPNKAENGQREIQVFFENDGKLWSDGKITASIFDQQSGGKIELGELDFYSLPADKRSMLYLLPSDLPAGSYTFIVQIVYGKENVVKVAEIDFKI
ncbi:fimbrial biogenesis chaperone [Myroides injenensis]|uniref:hypothetical protein n=1 Tax=Myroides injenensis TaxID=1183151 RepID=UPI00226D7D97|nr:hypothetical protein [Myroides injenensis]